MIKFRNAMIAGAALIAAPAMAQDTTAPAPVPEAAAPAAQAAPATVTDAEVKSFAKAALAADKVNKDTTIAAPDKGKKLAEVVTAAGIQPERFNQIATASSSDAELQKRIQAAITTEQGGAAPTR